MRFFEDPQNTSKNRQKERCYYIPGGVSEYHSMNGEWRFAYFSRDIDVPEKVSEWNKISVPSCWQTEGFENPNYTNINYPYPCDPPYVPDDDPVGVYEREFTLNKWGKVYYIFEGVSSLAVLYINGIFAGFTQGSHLQAEFDITDLVINGKNTVRVHVYKWCAGSYLESQDFFRMNGIFRDTYILQRPFDHIFDFTVRTTEKAVIVECDKQADILLYDAKGQLLASEENAVCTHLRVEDPVFWNAEEPYLYSLKISRNGETIEEKTAFRTIGISSEGELLINERPVKLHGVNRHDTHPKTGWSMTEDEMRDELLLMKRLNINCIRTAHYPPAPKLLSMCDEMGFYVILETDIETHGFLRRNANVPYRYDYESGEWPTSLPQWRDEFISRMKRAVIRDKNRPSVIMWSTGNESAFGENQIAMIEYLKTLGDGRLVHCEDASRLGFSQYADVFSGMYISFDEIEAYAADTEKKKPFFLCEYAHAMGNGPGDVYYYNQLFDKHKKLIGGCVWEWADHGVSDKNGVMRYGGDFEGELCHDENFCADGIVFAYRTLKAGSYEVKAAYQPMRTFLEGETLEITNRYDFTDFSQCRFFYTLEADGIEIRKCQVKLHALPHEIESIKIELPKISCKYGAYLNCFLERDGECVACTQHEIPCEIIANTDVVPFAVMQEDGENIIWSGEGFRYVFSKHYGTFTGIAVNGEEKLVSPMKLTLWRAPTDNDRNIKALWGSYDVWQGENLDKLFSKVYSCTADNECVIVSGSLAGVSRAPIFRYKLSVSVRADGKIELSLSGDVSERSVWLPRLGFELEMDGADNEFSYFAYGPHESYCDMHHGSKMGLYQSDTDKEYVNYVRPQEHGNHFNAKMLKICGLVFSGKSFEFRASDYSSYALHRAKHTDELIKDGNIHLRIDYKVSGIGSNSCGPELCEEYRLSEKEISFFFSIKPE